MQQKKTVEDIYQKMSPIEHILKRPDTYIGSTQRQVEQLWVFDNTTEKLVLKQIEYVPGLFKIFDEILVNAADNYQRDRNMDVLKVNIDQEASKISVWNNGQAIPVQMHKTENMYVPEMIFGVLLTGSNYDDNEKRVVGGRNGYGAKLANVYSKQFRVEVQDGLNKKYYSQTWTNNMANKTVPEVTKAKSMENFVNITFHPDLVRFSMSNLEDDMVSLLKKRVYDMAGVFDGKVKVYYNGTQIKINSFQKYMNLYFTGDNVIKIYDPQMKTPRWEVLVTYSPTQFQQISFVNGISTSKGGSHVNHVTEKIVNEIQNELTTNKKYKAVEVQRYQIKQSLWVFINCLIDNPSFDSQTKENMTSKVSEFGGSTSEKFHVTEKFSKDLLKTDILDAIMQQAKAKLDLKLNKTLKGAKSARLFGIDKLDDANDAGKKMSEYCTLILTEGDSAKSLVMGSLDVLGRDRFGVYPLRGKLLNVRDASMKQIINNLEIQNIIKIVGLQKDKTYQDVKSLRYGSIMLMADQDTDGSHIKGLIMNFVHHFWPSLIQIPGFLTEFVTPIIKVTKSESQIEFFTIQDFRKWTELQGTAEVKHWHMKYYKGLGTSEDWEAKRYFANLPRHRLYFKYQDENDDKSIDLCFNTKKANERKQWLHTYNSEDFVDHNIKDITYQDFVNKEMIHFSMYDNIRSIPSIVDGFKPGQRKVLFCCFKRNLKNELKVAQLGGYVAEHSSYHHGEVSLSGTIVGMAQNFPGSNNINLLEPKGQFGSRAHGGKDHASARYIFTNLSPLTRLIFPEQDDHTVLYKEDDGHMIEPEFYVPIIPMVLINGAEGIGTGWSTNVPNYNPRDIIIQIRRKIQGQEFQMIHPWYRGWEGDISESTKIGQYLLKGVWDVNQDTEQLDIMELPLKKWTKDFKELLEKMMADEDDKTFLDFREYHTKHRIHFQIQMNPEELTNANIESKFKLSTNVNTSNMVLFNKDGRLQKYTTVVEILEEFYSMRYSYYEKRKDYIASKLQREIQILENKVRFITGVIKDEIKLRNVKKKDVCLQLLDKGFTKQSDICKVRSTKILAFGEGTVKKITNSDNDSQNSDQEVKSQKNKIEQADYMNEFSYLLGMSILSLTKEKVEKLIEEQDRKQKELKILWGITVEASWLSDLSKFEISYDMVEMQDQKTMSREDGQQAKVKPMKKPKKKGGKIDEEKPEKPKEKKNKQKDDKEPLKKKRNKKINSDEDTKKSKPQPNKSKAATSNERQPRQAKLEFTVKTELQNNQRQNNSQQKLSRKQGKESDGSLSDESNKNLRQKNQSSQRISRKRIIDSDYSEEPQNDSSSESGN